MAREYVFVDEWDVDAPVEAVFDALADARTYPEWWRPVYRSVDGESAASAPAGSYAVVAVTIRPPRAMGAVVTDHLPLKFHHL